MIQINLFDKRIKQSILWLGWILFIILLILKGCGNTQTVTLPAITRTLPADTVIETKIITAEKWYKDAKAENKLKADIKEMYSRLLNYEEESAWMQEEFAHKDSLQKAELYRLATSLKSFESNFEDDHIEILINGILSGGNVKEITPTYKIKERTVNVPKANLSVLGGFQVGAGISLDKPVVIGNLGIQNAKGNIIRIGLDTEKRILVGYDFKLR
jgi:hypothetical protein